MMKIGIGKCFRSIKLVIFEKPALLYRFAGEYMDLLKSYSNKFILECLQQTESKCICTIYQAIEISRNRDKVLLKCKRVYKFRLNISIILLKINMK